MIEKIGKIYINERINKISNYKKIYQGIANEIIYSYISILRFILIEEGNDIRFINLFDIYNYSKLDNMLNTKLIDKIYKYMWELEKMTVFCYENRINYGLHNDEFIAYPITELNLSFNKIIKNIKRDLERIKLNYE